MTCLFPLGGGLYLDQGSFEGSGPHDGVAADNLSTQHRSFGPSLCPEGCVHSLIFVEKSLQWLLMVPAALPILRWTVAVG